MAEDKKAKPSSKKALSAKPKVESPPVDPKAKLIAASKAAMQERLAKKHGLGAAPTKVKPHLRIVTFEKFGQASSVRPEHLAGFLNYAKRQKLGPRSMTNWVKAYEEFKVSPVV